jgi:hypothetical protein
VCLCVYKALQRLYFGWCRAEPAGAASGGAEGCWLTRDNACEVKWRRGKHKRFDLVFDTESSFIRSSHQYGLTDRSSPVTVGTIISLSESRESLPVAVKEGQHSRTCACTRSSHGLRLGDYHYPKTVNIAILARRTSKTFQTGIRCSVETMTLPQLPYPAEVPR